MATMAEQRKRRKSLRNVFKRPETPPATPSLPSAPPSPVERRVEFPATSPDGSETSSPKIRPRTLQKTNRSSLFGSIRSLHSLDEEERVNLTRSDSKASSLQDEAFSPGRGLMGDNLIVHGEVQIAGTTMFRKRSHYIVLTESHLVRFKNQAKAAELFPILSPALSRSSGPRNSMTSVGSFNELQMSTYNDVTQAIALAHVVAIYKLDDGRPYFTLEVSYLDERASRASALQLQFNEPREADMWHTAVRSALMDARRLIDRPFQGRTLDYIAKCLESQRDYDPLHFQVFKVVQLSSLKSTGRSSSDDLSKCNTTVSYLAIGVNKIHFVPVPRNSTRSSSTSLNDQEAPTSLGLVTLTALKLQQREDMCQLHFRSPFGKLTNVLLASCNAIDIVLWARFACEYVRPEWCIQPLMFDVPRDVDEQMNQPDFPPEDHNSFDRTLIAYCAAYDVDTSKIVYTVDYECEDAPCFCLLPLSGGTAYNAMELLAVFRALRYNEFFASISFANIDLRSLREFYDPSDPDVDLECDRAGVPNGVTGHSALSSLSQEIRGLALKSRRLRRLDFTNAMSKPTKTGQQQSCGIPEALAPLSKKSFTNVDWIVLNGIQLGDSDLDYLVDMASERRCHFRALEVGDCGLSVHDVDVLLSTLSVHEVTMEVINIAGSQGRFSPDLFQRGIGAFGHLRKLNLTRVQKTAGPEPLIAPEVLLGWRLESLVLSQMTLNEQTIDGISAYLASQASDLLRELHVNQCGLTGKDLAVFLRAMSREQGVARNMHVNANENRLGVGSSSISKTLAANHGPTSLSMRMMDFEKEYHFRELVDALSQNSTLRRLDVSRASLPYDAGEETCEALKEMFANNRTLEELDISGEHAHLDAARFGIGLNIALLGLEKNTTLKLLRIEHQNLGLQGANTLAGVLEVNHSLQEIHCEHNDINLQSFTVLVNALKKNKTLLHLPSLSSDKEKSMEKIKDEFSQAERVDNHKISPKQNTLKKGMSVLTHKAPRHSHHRKNSSIASSVSFTDQDVAATLMALEDKWAYQLARMQRYLLRNYRLACGVPAEEAEFNVEDGYMLDEHDELDRPGTAESLGKILARVKIDRTPTMERGPLLDAFDEKLSGERKPLVFQLPED